MLTELRDSPRCCLDIDQIHEINHWYVAIEDKTRNLLVNFSPSEKIDVVSAALVNRRKNSVNIPWTVVFKDEGIDQACRQLLTTLRMPDGQTPFFNPKLHEAITQIPDIFNGCPYSTIEECRDLPDHYKDLNPWDFVMKAVIGVDRDWKIYQDQARRSVNGYDNYWWMELSSSFNPTEVGQAIINNPDLFSILARNRYLLELYTYHGFQPRENLTRKEIQQYIKLAYQLRDLPKSR